MPDGSSWCAARITGAMEDVLVIAIAQCQGFCAHISVEIISRTVRLVDSKSVEGLNGSDAMGSSREECDMLWE